MNTKSSKKSTIATRPDISVNITCHREGYLLYQTLRSISNSIDYLLSKNKLTAVSVNLSLDNADDTTINVAENFSEFNCEYNIYQVSFGQPALCRNYLIDKSDSKYIVFFDGDDLFSENYIYEAYKLAETKKTPCVLSVAMIMEFDQNNAIFIRPKLDIHNENIISYIMNENPVNSCVFAHTSIFKDTKYESVEVGTGFGYEDWHWNTKLFANKTNFYIIPNTVLFYRRCNDPARSVLANHTIMKTILRPSKLFSPQQFVINNAKYLESYNYNAKDNIINGDSKKLKFVKSLPIPSTFKIYLHDQYFVIKKLAINIRSMIRRIIPRSPSPKNIATEKSIELKDVLSKKLCRIIPNSIDVDVLLKQWIKANEFEPLIWPTSSLIENIPIFKYEVSSDRAKTYYDICKIVKDWDNNYNIVFVPWLIIGGADLVTLETVNHLAEQGENVLLVFTEKAKSEWKSELHDNIITFNLGDIDWLNDEDKNDIFIKLIINSKPSRFISVNSLFANCLMRDYSKVLSKYTKLYTYRFSLPKDDNGMYYEWPANFYNSIVENVTVISDNILAPNMYDKTFGRGIDGAKIIQMPIQEHPKPSNPKELKKRVLWASRIATDKLVLESIEIASKIDPGIVTDFYGTLDGYYSRNDVFEELIKDYPNIHYKGSFNGFSTIDVSKYDMLLFVSRSEGTPIVVLEAIGANLFIVASRVGGIPEVITNNVNGILIDDPLDVGAYVDAIKNFYNVHRPERYKTQTKLNSELINLRTVKNFKAGLSKIYYE